MKDLAGYLHKLKPNAVTTVFIHKAPKSRCQLASKKSLGETVLEAIWKDNEAIATAGGTKCETTDLLQSTSTTYWITQSEQQ